jgi:hypothetical protein
VCGSSERPGNPPTRLKLPQRNVQGVKMSSILIDFCNSPQPCEDTKLTDDDIVIRCFSALKAIFEQFFRLSVLNFPKMHQYGLLKQIKQDCYSF